MRFPVSVLAVACAFCMAAGAHAASQNTVPVRGTVSDAVTGKPVAGAIVGVYESGLGTVTTDRLGRFKLMAKPGKRMVYYDGGNPFYRSINGVTYTAANVPAKGISGVTLELFPVQFGRGKVFDETGMPLSGAKVTVCGDEFATTVTDAKGKFKIALPEDQAAPGG